MLNIIEDLPLEILPRVISYADCTSIKSLLFTYPSLRQYTVLILDSTVESNDQSLYLGIPGIKRFLLSEILRDKALLKHVKNDHFIKLYELEIRHLTGGLSFIWGPHSRDLLDDCSFIHFSEAEYGEIQGDWYRQCEYFISNGKGCPKFIYSTAIPTTTEWHYNNKTISDSMKLLVNKSYKEMSSISYTGYLVRSRLTIINTCIVKDLELPFLNTLFIHFQSDSEDHSPPVCANFILPQLVSLVVHFNHRPPNFQNIQVAHESSKDLGTITRFELCHTAGFNVFQHPLVDTLTAESMYDLSPSITFTQNFKQLQLVGVPDAFFIHMYLDNVTHLLWMRTVDYQNCHHTPLHRLYIPRLLSLTFQTNIPGYELPNMTYDSTHLEAIRVYTTAPGLQIGPLLVKNIYMSVNLKNTLQKVEIVCNLPLEEIGGKGHITLTDDDIYVLSSYRLTNVVVDGCYFQKENCGLSEPISINVACRYFIKFVRSRSQAEMDHLELVIKLKNHGLITGITGQIFDVSQRLGVNGAGWKTVFMDFGADHNPRMWPNHRARGLQRIL